MIPPGALQRQSRTLLVPPYMTSQFGSGVYPTWNEKVAFIYALINIVDNLVYVGRTKRSPYLRFLEHTKSSDYIGRAIRKHEDRFVVVVLEKLPATMAGMTKGELTHMQKRENSWIHRLNSKHKGITVG